MTNQKYNAYLTSQATIRKTKQVVMLYEGVITHLKRAKEAIKENNIELRYNSLEKAAGIIIGLQASLDFEQGEEISKMLDEFYFATYIRIMAIHHNKNIDVCNQLIEQLQGMQKSWEEVDQHYINNLDDNQNIA